MRRIFKILVAAFALIPFSSKSQSDTAYRGMWYYLVNPSTIGTFNEQIGSVKQSLHPRCFSSN